MNYPDPQPKWQMRNALRRQGIYWLPNAITTCGLFAGFYAIVQAMNLRFELAAIGIFAAMVFDGLDGRVARLTRTQSEFGAEYDSLADMVAFGAAPALVLYEWELKGMGRLGWLARSGPIPLGYLGDREKTARTFPRIGSTRYVVPGDRARWTREGRIEFLGRDATKINSAGEKIFAEEVELALKQHPAVLDAAVLGRPSERWGEEVVAVVQIQPGQPLSAGELLESCEGRLASFKLPKTILFRDEIRRGAAGKIDLAWLREEVTGEGGRS